LTKSDILRKSRYWFYGICHRPWFRFENKSTTWMHRRCHRRKVLFSQTCLIW